VTVNSSFFPIDNYKFQCVSVIGGPAAAATSTAANATGSATTAPTATVTAKECGNKQNPSVVAVGAGVGAPLALIACALGGWALVERRKRKRFGTDAPPYAPGSRGGYHQQPGVGVLSPGRDQKAELVSPSPILRSRSSLGEVDRAHDLGPGFEPDDRSILSCY
jgi:hypothetical protein